MAYLHIQTASLSSSVNVCLVNSKAFFIDLILVVSSEFAFLSKILDCQVIGPTIFIVTFGYLAIIIQ